MKTKYFLLPFFAACFLFLADFAQGSNVRILERPIVIYKGGDNGTTPLPPVCDNDSIAMIQFDVAWDYSWKTSKPANHDALWIYVKYFNGAEWKHAYLAESGHIPGIPSENSGYFVEEKTGGQQGVMVFEAGRSIAKLNHGSIVGESDQSVVVGLFLRRKEFGEGHVIVKNVGIQWDYKRQGMTVDDDLVVKVFAVEMVFVPEGAFEIGFVSSTPTDNRHAGGFVTFNSSGPGYYGGTYKITSEKTPIETGAEDGKLWTLSSHQPQLVNGGAIPDSFPKGYAAFYMMKYELTVEAFAEMLNCLDGGMADELTPAAGNYGINTAMGKYSELNRANTGYAYGHALKDGYTSDNTHTYGRVVLGWIKSGGGMLTYGADSDGDGILNETEILDTIEIGGVQYFRKISIDGQDIPMHICSPYMLVAYAGFAGLRPMTEFEYEKACRGSVPAKADEFAWGSSNADRGEYAMEFQRWNVWNNPGGIGAYINVYRGDEKVTTGDNTGTGGIYVKNDWWTMCRMSQLLRVGAFADTSTNRVSSGASYWGIMNMSDNAYEYTILATQPTGGLQFNGEHGNGQLIQDANGVYPVGENPWRLPTNTAYWWNIRGILLQDVVCWGWCTGNPASDHAGRRLNELMYSESPPHGSGRVGHRYLLNGGSGYASQKHISTFAGIRCVRTAIDTAAMQ